MDQNTRVKESAVKTVTVGIDGSESSVNALRWGAELADEIGAELTITYCWAAPMSLRWTAPESTEATIGTLQRQAEATADNAVRASLITRPFTLSVQSGDAGDALVALAGPDRIVVVGRTGRGKRRGLSRLSELLLGSTARYCLQHAPGPVAVVPRACSWAKDRAQQVIVGVDGSAPSAAALRWATAALPQRTQITAILATLPFVPGSVHSVELMLTKVSEAAAKAKLAAIVGAELPDDRQRLAVGQSVAVGEARTQLLRAAERADLMVVGTNGRTGLSRFLLGSVAESAVRNATCPVVVVPPDRQREVSATQADERVGTSDPVRRDENRTKIGSIADRKVNQ